MMERPEDNEIIQEATEAVEKNLNAGCYVGDLLRIVKEQKAKLEGLKSDYIRVCAERDARIATRRFTKSEAYRGFAESVYKFLCNKHNWKTFKEQWLENGECYWLKQSLDKLAKELADSNERDS